MAQYFKGDDLEIKIEECGKAILDSIGLEIDEFYTEAYNAEALGGVIYDTGRSPLANAIERDIYITTFNELFTTFEFAGTFEAYISVFEKIFGESVDVTFVVPAPGKLEINILAEEVELSEFVSRTVQDNQFVFDNVVTQDDDQIVFQSIKGFKTQSELETMLFEMVPAGVFTDIDLTLG